MIFLVVRQKRKATIFGQTYDLEPVSYPKIDLNQILVCDDPIGTILLARHKPLLLQANFDAHQIPGFPRPLKHHPSKLPPNSKLIILRSGGIGDHIMMTPAIRALKQTLPMGSELWLATEKVHHCLFEGNSDVSRVFPLPVRMSHLMGADYYLDFSSAFVSLYKEINMTDYCLHCFNIDYATVKDKRPRIPNQLPQSPTIGTVFDDIRAQNQGRPIVLLHWFTSTLIRDVPLELLAALPAHFPDVVFIAAHEQKDAGRTQKQIDRLGLQIINLSAHMQSLQDYSAAISHCDAVVCADTCTYHIAAALEKPALVLFGPVGSGLRIRYYPTVIPLDADYSGLTCTSPCGIDRIWKDDMKEEKCRKKKNICPEAQAKTAAFSPCLASIAPQRLIRKFCQLIDTITP